MLIRLLPGALFAVFLLWWLVRGMDGRKLLQAFLHLEIGWLLLLPVFKTASAWIKAKRWQIAMEAVLGWRPTGTFSATMLGFLGNQILPARLGEVLRAHVLHEKNPEASRSIALTSSIISQLFDVLFLLLLLLLAALLWNSTSLQIPQVLGGLLLLFLGFASIYVFHRMYDRLRPLGRALTRFLPTALTERLAAILAQINQGLGLLHRPKAVWLILLWSALLWMLELASYYALLRAFSLPATLVITLVICAGSNLTFLLPLTPGGVGVHQAFCVWSMAMFGIREETALAFSLMMQTVDNLVIFSLGGFFFSKEGLRWQQMQNLRSNAPADALHPTPPADEAPKPMSSADEAPKPTSPD